MDAHSHEVLAALKAALAAGQKFIYVAVREEADIDPDIDVEFEGKLRCIVTEDEVVGSHILRELSHLPAPFALVDWPYVCGPVPLDDIELSLMRHV